MKDARTWIDGVPGECELSGCRREATLRCRFERFGTRDVLTCAYHAVDAVAVIGRVLRCYWDPAASVNGLYMISWVAASAGARAASAAVRSVEFAYEIGVDTFELEPVGFSTSAKGDKFWIAGPTRPAPGKPIDLRINEKHFVQVGMRRALRRPASTPELDSLLIEYNQEFDHPPDVDTLIIDVDPPKPDVEIARLGLALRAIGKIQP